MPYCLGVDMGVSLQSQDVFFSCKNSWGWKWDRKNIFPFLDSYAHGIFKNCV